jgi:hypothetical protein
VTARTAAILREPGGAGAHVLDAISFISDVGPGRLAEIAGGAALATREQQDRAKTADED